MSMTIKEASLLSKAMELCNSMMQFSGCELYSYNTRLLLRGLKATINSIGDEGDSITAAKISLINLLIDTLLEEEGIAEAEMLAGCDPEPHYEEDWDDHDEVCCEEDSEEECYGPDPMWSAADAFAQLEIDAFNDECEKESYLSGHFPIEAESVSDDTSEIEAWANTPHAELNHDLKDAIETLENIRAAKAIWRAREKMMNKIVFRHGYTEDVYPVHHVTFGVDEHGVPVDIEISTRLKYLDLIAEEHGQLGYCCADDEEHGFYTALYGRLDSFSLYDCDGNLLWDYRKPYFSF